jgi:hypothetical protein
MDYAFANTIPGTLTNDLNSVLNKLKMVKFVVLIGQIRGKLKLTNTNKIFVRLVKSSASLALDLAKCRDRDLKSGNAGGLTCVILLILWTEFTSKTTFAQSQNLAASKPPKPSSKTANNTSAQATPESPPTNKSTKSDTPTRSASKSELEKSCAQYLLARHGLNSHRKTVSGLNAHGN